MDTCPSVLPVVLEKEEVSLKQVIWYIYEPDCECILEQLYPLLLHALMYDMCMENQNL